MGKLNLEKAIEQGRKIINSNYDLTMENLIELYEKRQDKGETICNAFVFGYYQGVKAIKTEMKKKGVLI